MKPTSEQLIKDIQSVMDEHIEVSINYKNIIINYNRPVRGLTKIDIPIPYEIPIKKELFGNVFKHILEKAWELWLDIYDPNEWAETDASCPKGESYRERNYMDIDYLTWTYGTHGQITSHMSAGDVLHTHSEDIEGDIAQTKVFEELREYYSHRIKISEEQTNG